MEDKEEGFNDEPVDVIGIALEEGVVTRCITTSEFRGCKDGGQGIACMDPRTW